MWGVPLAAAAVFLGWFAAIGGRPETRRMAKTGCLGGLLLAGGTLALLSMAALLPTRDVLEVTVLALQYAPLAGTLGVVGGLGLARMRKRRR